MDWLWHGGNRPTDLPQWVYSYLVLTLKVNPDSTSKMKCAQLTTYLRKSQISLIRVFNSEGVEPVIQVKDFRSLDRHPELILYEGYMDKASGTILLTPCLYQPLPES